MQKVLDTRFHKGILAAFFLLISICFAQAQTRGEPGLQCRQAALPSENQKTKIIQSVREFFRGESLDSEIIRDFSFDWKTYIDCLVKAEYNFPDVRNEDLTKPSEELKKVLDVVKQKKISKIFDALGLKSDSAEDQTIAAQVAFLLGYKKEAIGLAQEAKQLDNNNFETHYVLGFLPPN